MRVVITGAGGFIGSWLCRSHLADGHEVFAWTSPSNSKGRIPGVPDFAGIPVDIADTGAVARMLSEHKPDLVYHLAAQSYPNASWDDPVGTFRVNVGGTINLLGALCEAGLSPLVISAGSSAEYAPRRDGAAIREDDRLDPSSPYGVSKFVQDGLSELHGGHLGLRVIRVRPFFLVGPGKAGDVSSDFARRFIHAARTGEREVQVGNLDIVRDLLDIRDGIRAFRVLAARGIPGEVYNICSGTGYRIGDIFDTLNRITALGLVAVPDPALLRPVDEMIKIGSPLKLEGLGWKPVVNLLQTMNDILDYWRQEEPVCK